MDQGSFIGIPLDPVLTNVFSFESGIRFDSLSPIVCTKTIEHTF